MRKTRFKLPAGGSPGFYHCTSRVVDGRRVFDAEAKAYFVQLMREAEEFCEVRVLAYCVMDDHVHLLVQVPERPAPENRPSPDAMLAKLAKLTGHVNVDAMRQKFADLHQAGDAEGQAAYLATFHERLWDLSSFMSQLKQRITLWINKRVGRKGGLWEERFTSVLIEGHGLPPVLASAYLDLNPVRAGLVAAPKDYPWCSYGAAVGGDPKARQALQFLVKVWQHGHEDDPDRAIELYRRLLSGPNRASDGVPHPDSPTREAALAILRAKGHLPIADYLRCRIRYFSGAAAIGSREFVEGVFKNQRDQFSTGRKTGARRMKGLADAELFVLRDLQLDVFG